MRKSLDRGASIALYCNVADAKRSLNAMPLFVKRGSVIALVDCKQNTKLIDWGNLTLDYYPSKFIKIFIYQNIITVIS